MLQHYRLFEADVYKIAYPGDVRLSSAQNAQICEQVSELLPKPWIILSAGIDKETFKEQLRIACKHGCSGYAIGRSLWKEYLGVHDERKRKEMIAYIQELQAIVQGEDI